MVIRELGLEHARDVAMIHREAFDARLPWLSGRHTPQEDEHYFRNVVFVACRVCGAFDDGLLGFIAVREGWIDQLYVRPQDQGRGAGSALIARAQALFPTLSLWTFKANVGARAFYEKRGFVAIEETDGARNDEREPDVRYVWRR